MTTVTHGHSCLFGREEKGEMVLSAIGRVASAQWLELPYRFADLELGEWVIMPNHIHGILVITGKGEASFTGRSDASAVFSRDPLVGDFASPLYMWSHSWGISLIASRIIMKSTLENFGPHYPIIG